MNCSMHGYNTEYSMQVKCFIGWIVCLKDVNAQCTWTRLTLHKMDKIYFILYTIPCKKNKS